MPVRRGSGAPHTAACDEVHFGVVEMFRDGAWNLLCARDPGRFAGPGGPFSDLDAAVVCRQLGFPFGTTFNEDDSDDADSGAAGGGAYSGAAGPRGVIDAEVRTSDASSGKNAYVNSQYSGLIYGWQP